MLLPKVYWVVLAVLVCAAGAAGAQPASPPPPPPARTISGAVVDAASNAPIANATVKLGELTAQTDGDGMFSLAGAPEGEVALAVTAADHEAKSFAVAGDKNVVRLALAPTAPPPPPPVKRTVHGRVVDVAGDPVAGATITIAGTRQSVLTEADGTFALADVAAGELRLQIDAAGYKPHSVPVLAGVDEVSATLELVATEQVFIEGRAPVIVKQNLANGASVITSEDLNRVSAPTLDAAMQGKISGANLQTDGGAPGGGAQLRLRGISTINGQSSPLYVVDGVIVSNVEIASGLNGITHAANGPGPSNQDQVVNRIADLNPNDIDNVEVLKGAAAAALYGSKAANGVVIITTKHGRAGKTTVTALQRIGFAQQSNELGSRTFHSLQEVMDAFPTNPAAAAAYMQGKTYDHEAELSQIKGARETIISASGGGAHGTYYGSVLVRDEPGVVTNTGYSKESGRLSASWRLGKRFELAATANLIHTSADRGINNNDNVGASTYVVLSSTPSFFDLRPQNGSYPVNPFSGSGTNPLQTQSLLTNNEDVWRMISAANATLRALDEEHQKLTLRTNFGFDYFHQHDTLYSPPELYFEPADGLPGTSIDGNANNLNANVNTSAVYTYEPANGAWKSATTAGFTYEYVDLGNVSITSQNLTAGQQNVGSATSIYVQQNKLRTKDQGLYLQEEVSLLDHRLNVLAGLLGERSSLNGDTDHFYVFPKLAATYEIPQKQFDTLRVRAALGEAGNRPNYGQKFTALNTTTNIGGNAGITIVNNQASFAGDPTIRPERQLEIEGGIDAAYANQRVVAELTVYQRTISDLLLQRTLPPSSGFGFQNFNGGELRNRGIEAAVQVLPVVEPVEWTTRAIFTLNRSTITSLPIPAFDISSVGFGDGLGAFRIEQGKSATQIIGTIDGTTIQQLGDAEPTFRVGWANHVRYGCFGLTTLLDWQQGSDVINTTRLLYDFGQNSPDYLTAGKARLDKFSQGDIRPYIEDATFVKLRELSVYWNAPDALAHRMQLAAARVSLSGRNLLTFTSYSGLDPEVSNFGAQSIARNYDVAPYPPSRSFWLSVEATY